MKSNESKVLILTVSDKFAADVEHSNRIELQKHGIAV